jgi:hypothetical protein
MASIGTRIKTDLNSARNDFPLKVADNVFLNGFNHRDDVCDAHRYAEYFSAKRIVHLFDSDAQKDAELILDGEGVHKICSSVMPAGIHGKNKLNRLK